MKIEIHKAKSRGRGKLDWLESYHTFSFAEYYDPSRVRFGVLRVINDDIIKPSGGFGTHPHNDMEIITVPIYGALRHKDNMGNESVITADEVQLMSAGTGVTHSEYNNSDSEDINLLQIWVFPDKKDLNPGYSQKRFEPAGRKNKFQLIVSPKKSESTVLIHQNAYFSLIDMDNGKSAQYKKYSNDNGLYLFVIEGGVNVDGNSLSRRDGAAIKDFSKIEITADKDSKLLLMEVPV